MSFKFYADAALTVPLTKLALTRGATPSERNATVFLGSTVAAEQLQNTSDPGVDPVQVSIVDGAGGSGMAASDVKIAASYAGLSSATAGASLDLSGTLNGGVANAVAIYVRVAASTTTPGTYDDVSLVIANPLLIGG